MLLKWKLPLVLGGVLLFSGCSIFDSSSHEEIDLSSVPETVSSSYKSELVYNSEADSQSTQSTAETTTTTTYKSQITSPVEDFSSVSESSPLVGGLISTDLENLEQVAKTQGYASKLYANLDSSFSAEYANLELKLGRDLVEVGTEDQIGERLSSYPYIKLKLTWDDFESVQMDTENFVRLQINSSSLMVLDSLDSFDFNQGETFICVGCYSPGGAVWLLPLVHTSDNERYNKVDFSYSLLQ